MNGDAFLFAPFREIISGHPHYNESGPRYIQTLISCGARKEGCANANPGYIPLNRGAKTT